MKMVSIIVEHGYHGLMAPLSAVGQQAAAYWQNGGGSTPFRNPYQPEETTR